MVKYIKTSRGDLDFIDQVADFIDHVVKGTRKTADLVSGIGGGHFRIQID